MKEAYPELNLNFEFEQVKSRDLIVAVECDGSQQVIYSRAATGGYPQKDLPLFHESFRKAIDNL